MKKLILILIIIAAITEGCKKYEDGTFISLRSAEKRLYGDYILTKYTVNGEDSLSLFHDSLNLNFHCSSPQNHTSIHLNIYGERKDGNESGCYMTCGLTEKNKIFKVYDTGGLSIGTGPFGYAKKTDWEILRLTNKELNMKTTYNGKAYYVELLEN